MQNMFAANAVRMALDKRLARCGANCLNHAEMWLREAIRAHRFKRATARRRHSAARWGRSG